ncbi:hypothetical protein M404DRAFT_161136, partial [Pisolithus tinctorius Marx 270]
DPDHVLRPPYEMAHKLDCDLHERIARYLGQVLGKRSSEIKKQLPALVLFTAGKLRVRHGGDLFRTKEVSHRFGALERRNCYVRVGPSWSDTHNVSSSVLTQTGYGDLEKIIALVLPATPLFGELRGKTIVVALVRPWDTDGKVASEEVVFFESRKARIIMDIRSLRAVVGLVKTQGRWGIIDRAPGTATTTFADNMMEGYLHDEHGDDDDFIL